MLGLLPLAGLLFLSGEFGAHATVVAEGRVGQAPFQGYKDKEFSTAPKAAAFASMSPIGDVEYESARAQVLLDYGPRIFWRRPNPFYNNKPLVLHVANLSATVDATRTVRLIERASFSYGEADYQALTRLGLTQGTLPPVLDILALSAGTGLRWDAGATWRFESMFNVEHRRALGTPPEDQMLSAMATFRQTNLFLDASGIGHLSRRTDLVLTLGVSDRFLNSALLVDGVELLGITPQVGFRTRLNWSTELRASAGFTYVKGLQEKPLPGTDGVVRPVGTAEIAGLLWRRRGLAWSGGFGATVDYFVDPFLNTTGPRGLLAGRTQVMFEPAWTVGLEGTFATSLREKAIPDNPNANETFLEVALPVRHRVSPYMIVEGGLRWSQRAPRIRADDVTFRERQNWIYVAFTGTTRRLERWTGPQPTDGGGRDEGAFARVQTADVPPTQPPDGATLQNQANPLVVPAAVEPAIGSEAQ